MVSDGRLERLAPSAFALVMATGIVAFGGLAALHALRVARHRDAVRADLRDPVRAPG